MKPRTKLKESSKRKKTERTKEKKANFAWYLPLMWKMWSSFNVLLVYRCATDWKKIIISIRIYKNYALNILWTPGFGNAKNNLDFGNSDFKTEFWLQIFINLKLFGWPCWLLSQVNKTNQKNILKQSYYFKNWSWKSAVPRSRFFPTRGRTIQYRLNKPFHLRCRGFW